MWWRCPYQFISSVPPPHTPYTSVRTPGDTVQGDHRTRDSYLISNTFKRLLFTDESQLIKTNTKVMNILNTRLMMKSFLYPNYRNQMKISRLPRLEICPQSLSWQKSSQIIPLWSPLGAEPGLSPWWSRQLLEEFDKTTRLFFRIKLQTI